MFPLVDDKRIFYNQLANGFKDFTWALVPLSANLSDVSVMEIALKVVSFFMISMLVVIIVTGIGSTWRVIVMKRLGELGIYRSVGMQRHVLLATLLWEAVFLVFAGCTCGVFFALLAQKLIQFVDFTFIPSFDIFLTDGKIIPRTDWLGGASVIALVCVATLAVVLYSVRKTTTIMPSIALSSSDSL